MYTSVSDNINTLHFVPSPVAFGGDPEVYNRGMAGLLCGTKKKKQGNLVLIVAFEEHENANAGLVTFVHCGLKHVVKWTYGPINVAASFLSWCSSGVVMQ